MTFRFFCQTQQDTSRPVAPSPRWTLTFGPQTDPRTERGRRLEDRLQPRVDGIVPTLGLRRDVRHLQREVEVERGKRRERGGLEDPLEVQEANVQDESSRLPSDRTLDSLFVTFYKPKVTGKIQERRLSDFAPQTTRCCA